MRSSPESRWGWSSRWATGRSFGRSSGRSRAPGATPRVSSTSRWVSRGLAWAPQSGWPASPSTGWLARPSAEDEGLHWDIDVAFEGKVVIIGAGAAGLAAGYLLDRYGIDFEILEARWSPHTPRSARCWRLPGSIGCMWFLLACTGGEGEGTSSLNVDTDGDGVVDFEDCAPEDPQVFPGNSEVCDGIDNDCDGVSDGAAAEDVTTWYIDGDGDGYGSDNGAVNVACDQPSGFADKAGDCDDLDPAVHPETVWYPDVDGDGYGDEETGVAACESPGELFTHVGGDCFDGDATVHPDADEYCDGKDTDCDGVLDDDDALDAQAYYVDDDGDGFGGEDSLETSCSVLSGYGTEGGDCDDANPDVFPGSTKREVPFDGIDNDCDGVDWCTDLDCDGRPDLVLPIYYDGDSYEADSWAYFATQSGLSDGSRRELPTYGALDAHVEDLDGDGYQDVVFSSYRDDVGYDVPSQIYWGTDGGPKSSSVSQLSTVGVGELHAEDLDGDGYTDLFFQGRYDGSYDLSSYIYWGPDYSDEGRTELASSQGYGVATGDIDADGYTDIVVCNYRDSSSYTTESQIFWGSVDGYSDELTTDLSTIGCHDVLVEDLNGDGWLDVVFAGYYGGSSYSTASYVYWGFEGGPSSAYRDSLPTIGSWDVEVGDIDQDGFLDLVFGGYRHSSWSSSVSQYIYYGSALGYSSEVVEAITLKGVADLELADYDGDGWLDLLTPVHYDGSTYKTTSKLWWGSASGYSTDAVTDFDTHGAYNVATGDLDRDGGLDLVFGSYYSGTWANTSSNFVYWSSDDWSTGDELETMGNSAKPIIVGGNVTVGL
ncbi:MAG: NAD(P)-binding protein [Proteobacteria bacterium]|nr:NAD(P)-binding protein [Pseudomonadota bacterium]MCP4920454.1 NAD(P)-binding protein [Pseudomonadota bacterium]